MPFDVRQNATHKVTIGPVVAVGDGFTPVTTLTLGSADEAAAILHDNGTVVDISGYTFAAIASADGYYHLTLQSGISSTVGHLRIVINDDSLCLPVKEDFEVIEEAVYDRDYAAGATGVDADWTNGGRLDSLIDAIPTTAMRGTDSAATAAALVTAQNDLDTITGADGVNLLAATQASIDAIEADTNELQGDWTNAGRLDVILDSILADTAEIGAAGVGLTDLGGMSTTMKGQVNTEVDGAIVTYKLDHLVFVAESGDVVDNSIIAKLAANGGDWSDFSSNTDSLEAIRDEGFTFHSANASLNSTINTQLNGLLPYANELVGSTGNDTTHVHLDDVTYADDEINDYLLVIQDSSESERHARWIEDFDGTSKLATVDTLPFTPSGSGDRYWVCAIRRDTTPDALGVQAKLDVNAEADAAIVTYGLDHLVFASVTGTDIADDSIVASLVSKEATADWDDYVNTTDSLQANADNIGVNGAALSAAWTIALTESYAADGAAFTGAQALYEICQMFGEFSISDTTITVKKRDGSTTALTSTLDSATAPITSRTRAT